MVNIGKKLSITSQKARLIAVLLLGALLRLVFIGNIPGNGNIYVDEAMSGYEAWSMLHYGVDLSGYHFPVYLTTWGAGMSSLQAYIQIPFVGIFGLNSFAIRLPAAILGCITLYAFYYICRNIKDEEFAIFAVFILSVMPWHIMQSRWGLDCNYFAGFITITIALLIKASMDSRFMPLAFLFMGLTLYTYALSWTFMPLFVLGSVGYLVYKKRDLLNRYLVISFVILAVIALPLMLFVLVNVGMIPEITTPFLSIPKLVVFRSGELILSPKNILKNFYYSLSCFVKQDDGYKQSVTPMFGLYYKFSGILILIGIAHSIVTFIDKRKELRYEFMLLLLFICSLGVAATIELSFYRINMIHIPVTFFLADALWAIAGFIKNRSKEMILIIYGISCICFMSYYVTIQDEEIAVLYKDGCKDALSYIHDLKSSGQVPPDEKVHVLSDMSFAYVLFYDQYPTDKFIEEVVYADLSETGTRLLAKSFGDYVYSYSDPIKDIDGSEGIYVCFSKDYELIDYMDSLGMDLNWFSTIVVAVAK